MTKRNVQVVISIPYRDREGQWIEFMQQFEKFVNDSPEQNVRSWIIILVDQFDAELFNRGWLFNVGLDLSLRRAASTGSREPDCVVIHDVDMIPQVGVDYSNCEWPLQLSSEIDRWGWSILQPHYTGGVVSMSPAHWRQINAFPNNYFGWGGEDDDLMQRLNQNNLGRGVSTHLGKALLRPPKHHGRFSSLSDGHTLRIAREQSVLLKDVESIQRGSEKEKRKWKNDGLNSLKYSVISEDIWTSPNQPSIEYHRARVRRGDSSHWDLRRVRVLVTSSLCPNLESSKIWWRFDGAVPKTVRELRAIIGTKPLPEGCQVGSDWIAEAGLVAVDLSWSFARPLTEDDTLIKFFRQLVEPALGIILVHHRGLSHLVSAFASRNSVTEIADDPKFTQPATTLICWGRKSAAEPPSLMMSPCRSPSDDWRWEGFFLALRSPRIGAKAYCIGRRLDGSSRVEQAEDCGGFSSWKNWQHVGSFYLPEAGSTKLQPQELRRQVCVKHESGHAEPTFLTEDGSCSGLRFQPLGLDSWDSVWAVEGGARLLQKSPSGCHLFICSTFFLSHSGGRFVDNRESGN